jgi:hypothetical protein
VLCMGRTYAANCRSLHNMALNLLRGAFTVEESNTARVLARTTEGILFSLIKKCPNSLSIEASLLPVQISTALN